MAYDKLLALGFTGSERTTRRAVAAVKKNYRLGRVRVHRPWVTEPGMWLQYDFGDGPLIDGAKTTLFCAWLAWSRFRVVLAIRLPDLRRAVRDDRRVLVGFDRGGWSPTLFAHMDAAGFDVLTWRKGVAEDVDESLFTNLSYVDRARQSGTSWSVIGARLGISRQGAQQRFSHASTRKAGQRRQS